MSKEPITGESVSICSGQGLLSKDHFFIGSYFVPTKYISNGTLFGMHNGGAGNVGSINVSNIH
jgi:hypothetical protein